jgi:hypothetical protein
MPFRNWLGCPGGRGDELLRQSRSVTALHGDAGQTDDTVDEAKTFRNAITPKNSYGAIYRGCGCSILPVDPRRYGPPSGFVAGMYAKTDGQRACGKRQRDQCY